MQCNRWALSTSAKGSFRGCSFESRWGCCSSEAVSEFADAGSDALADSDFSLAFRTITEAQVCLGNFEWLPCNKWAVTSVVMTSKLNKGKVTEPQIFLEGFLLDELAEVPVGFLVGLTNLWIWECVWVRGLKWCEMRMKQVLCCRIEKIAKPWKKQQK